MATTSRRTTRRPRPGPVLAAAVVVIGLAALGAACGDDGSSPSTTVSATSKQRATTTERETTTTGSEEPSTTTTSVGTDTTVPGALPADEERTDPSWSLTAAEFRGQDGRRIAVTCAPGGTFGSVWGSDPYTDDSSICTAAVHAGLITPADGGRVVVEVRPGEPAYTGTEANGVTSSDYGSWGGSFIFLGRD